MRARRRRARGLLRLTLVGALVGVWVAVTAIAQIYVLSTDRPVSPPGGLTFVRTGTYNTRYQAWGRSSAPAIVLVHGAFESVAYWQPLARELAHTYHVEAYDLKGYGYTDHVGPYTTEALANQLFDFLKARHLAHPILVGHSLGAGVVARFVLDHPHVARGIVFLDGDGLAASLPGRQLLDLLINPYRTAIFRFAVRSDALVRTIFKVACGPECPSLSASQLEAVRRPLEVAGAEQALFAYAARPIVGVRVSDLNRIREQHMSALVVVGSRDFQFSIRSARLTARRIGAPPPVVIEGAGHLTMWSNPGRVAQVLERFASRIVSKYR
ncbi:MAG: alpha/beta hydrolase [Acidimicrobiaceae bacterium]|nr:alpha/beta hydrolase [Acidimicrobiaceae bacterium]